MMTMTSRIGIPLLLLIATLACKKDPNGSEQHKILLLHKEIVQTSSGQYTNFYKYDGKNRVIEHVAGQDGLTYSYSYDADGRLQQVDQYDYSRSLISTRVYSYPYKDTILVTLTELGQQYPPLKYILNAKQQLIRTVSPGGAGFTFTYHADGSIARVELLNPVQQVYVRYDYENDDKWHPLSGIPPANYHLMVRNDFYVSNFLHNPVRIKVQEAGFTRPDRVFKYEYNKNGYPISATEGDQFIWYEYE